MTALTATIQIEEDMSAIVEELLRSFPKGSRVQVALTELSPPCPVPDLHTYRQSIAKAREAAPVNPWKTSNETMQALREGDLD